MGAAKAPGSGGAAPTQVQPGALDSGADEGNEGVELLKRVWAWITASTANKIVTGVVVALVLGLVVSQVSLAALATQGSLPSTAGGDRAASPTASQTRAASASPTPSATPTDTLTAEEAAYVRGLRDGAPHALTMSDRELADIGLVVCEALEEAWAGPNSSRLLRTFYDANLDDASDADGADIADAAIRSAADNLPCLVRGTSADERAAALRAVLVVPEGTRWAFQCGSQTVVTLAEAWASGEGRCNPTLKASMFTATPEEATVIAAYRAAQPGVGVDDQGAYRTVLEVCAQTNPWVSTYFSVSAEEARVALETLCPEAPHAQLLRQITSGEAFGAGTWQVGTDIPAGRYRSKVDVTDCYWERLTRNGNIIANDFLSAAVDGVTVTVRDGEVFNPTVACGYWTRES